MEGEWVVLREGMRITATKEPFAIHSYFPTPYAKHFESQEHWICSPLLPQTTLQLAKKKPLNYIGSFNLHSILENPCALTFVKDTGKTEDTSQITWALQANKY